MRRNLVLLSASLLALTACSDKTSGTATPSSGTPSQAASTTSGQPSSDVPKVENPIDITHFRQTPCDALTAAQVQGFLGSGVTPKPQLDAAAGPTCNIDAVEGQAGVNVLFGKSGLRHGMADLYAAKGKAYPFFQPLQPIDGYPVVAYGEDDQRGQGRCIVAIGVSDEQTVDVMVSVSEANIGKKDPCDAAHNVAGDVLGNLKAVR